MITEAAKFYIADLYSPPSLNGKSDKLIRKKNLDEDGVFVSNKVKCSFWTKNTCFLAALGGTNGPSTENHCVKKSIVELAGTPPLKENTR